jgi:hypothetical protein
LKRAAARVGARLELNKNVGVFKIEGKSWGGSARVGGDARATLGEYLELVVQHHVDPASAEARARASVVSMKSLAPLLDLVQERRAQLRYAVRLDFGDRGTFGYLQVDGFGSCTEDELGRWLQARGLTRAGDGPTWSLGGAPPVVLSLGPDSLRGDIAGLADLENISAPPTVARPPSVEDVLQRAQCLGLVWRRSTIESAAKGGKARGLEALEEESGQLMDWAAQWQVYPALTSNERRWLLLPIGGWIKSQLVQASWCVEAIGAMAFALGVVPELPDLEVPFSGAELAELTSTRGLRATEILARAAEAMAPSTAGPPSRRRSTAIERVRALRWVCQGGAWDDGIE